MFAKGVDLHIQKKEKSFHMGTCAGKNHFAANSWDF
jgi:hypothetical protein